LLSAGALDPTFGAGGKVTTAFPGAALTLASDVVVQPNGRIVTVGVTYSAATGFQGDLALARYLPDGRLDPSFGTGGRVVTDLGGDEFFPKAALQSDGKIVVAGTTYAPGDFVGDFAVARYNPDGSLDAGFGARGKVITDFGGNEALNDIAVQPNGKIVVVGTSFDEGDFALARYNADGSLDAGFGAGGKVITDLGGYDSASSVAIQPNGKVVVGGDSFNLDTFNDDLALARYSADGSLDPSFGTGGKVIANLGAQEAIGDIALQANGKIVALGTTIDFVTSNADFELARFNTDGSLDTTFGAGGHVTTDFGGFDVGAEVVIQPDGKIVAAGPYQGLVSDFGLARYNSDGSPDAGFGTDGVVTTDFGGDFNLNFNVALQPDGKIVSAGTAFDPDTGGLVIAVARYEGHATPSDSHPAISSSSGAALGLAIDGGTWDWFFSELPSRKRRGGVG
jgi:uncharacterized delta-60 repeat protein